MSLINTIPAMAVDVETRRPRLANVVGGLSGPAVRPIAVRMVWEVAQGSDLPVIGMGGIANAEDALEFLLVGAAAVQIGTMNFVEPRGLAPHLRRARRVLPPARGRRAARSDRGDAIGNRRVTMPPAGSGPPAPPHPDWVAKPGAGELVVAVDTPSLDEALRLRDTLAGASSFYKVGKELFTAAGPRAVSEFSSVGRVFLDLKFHDIPATVAGAVRASASLGASILDVHASGGRPMLEAAARAASSAPAPPVLLGVTVLTHLDPESAAEVIPGVSIRDQVLNLARLARSAGLGGVVGSAAEAEALRDAFGDGFVLLVPGVPAAVGGGYA